MKAIRDCWARDRRSIRLLVAAVVFASFALSVNPVKPLAVLPSTLALASAFYQAFLSRLTGLLAPGRQKCP
jgi:hypothetical protein